MTLESYIAATRFGLGALPGRPETKDGLMRQLEGSATSAALAGLGTTDALIGNIYAIKDAAGEKEKQAARHVLRRVYVTEMQARMTHGIVTDTPLLERMLLFWSNHFSISRDKARLVGIVGAYEREAIRPYVTGRFVDMLVAVTRHPGMLLYLDNQQSIGPNSKQALSAVERPRNAKPKSIGLNENLAREILELHTLGVDGGYSQADVTSFAKVITGWTVTPPNAQTRGFVFQPKQHEPGAQTVLGVQYAQPGEEQGLAVLDALAKHPSTARHIARKLARHFIADQPSQASVDALAQSFLQSGGDLKTVYRTLIGLPEAWQMQRPKIRGSYELILASLRATGMPKEHAPGQKKDGSVRQPWLLQSFEFLGQAPFSAGSPAGFSDLMADVAGPEAMLRRAEWAQTAARVLPVPQDVKAVAEAVIGPVMSATTRQAIASAADARTQLALLIASPEFQRR